MSLQKEFTSSIWRHLNISIKLRYSLCPIYQNSSRSLSTIKNRLSTYGRTPIDSIFVYRLLDPQLTWPIQVGALIILVILQSLMSSIKSQVHQPVEEKCVDNFYHWRRYHNTQRNTWLTSSPSDSVWIIQFQ